MACVVGWLDKGGDMSESLLSKEIKKQIPLRFGRGKCFSALDFADLAVQFNSRFAAVTQVLAGLESKKLICVVGWIRSKRGGYPRKIYKLSSVCSLSVAAYRDRILETEEANTACALRLHAVLDKITRVNLTRAQG